MADLAYTDADAVAARIGQLGLDLRTDDDSQPTLVEAAIDYGSARVDFYCGGGTRYAPAELAASRWVQAVATLAAVMWLCRHRLNEVPASILEEWEEFLAELQAIQKGTAEVPGAARSRRGATVTNQRVDLRLANNNNRTDRGRSTGVAKDYKRPVDYRAPDQR